MKLSKTKKERIVKVVLNHSFKAREDFLKEEVKKFTSELMIEAVKECEGWEKFKNFINTTQRVYLVDGKNKYNNDYMTVYLDEEYPDFNHYSNDWSFNSEDYPEIKTFIKKEMSLSKLRDTAKENIRGVLNSCNTEKQLLKTLPEIEPLIKDMISETSVTALVPLETIEKVKRLLN